jgi:hypothetical protein
MLSDGHPEIKDSGEQATPAFNVGGAVDAID